MSAALSRFSWAGALRLLGLPPQRRIGPSIDRENRELRAQVEQLTQQVEEAERGLQTIADAAPPTSTTWRFHAEGLSFVARATLTRMQGG